MYIGYWTLNKYYYYYYMYIKRLFDPSVRPGMYSVLTAVVSWDWFKVLLLYDPIEGMGRLQFSDLFIELAVPPQAAGVVRTLY